MIELTDTKLAIAVIGGMSIVIIVIAYAANVLDSSIVIGIFSTGVAAIAGLAGYDTAKKQQQSQ